MYNAVLTSTVQQSDSVMHLFYSVIYFKRFEQCQTHSRRPTNICY